MLKKLMSFLFEEEEEEVYADGELEEAIFKDVPPKTMNSNIMDAQPKVQSKAQPRPFAKPQTTPPPRPQPIQQKVANNIEAKRFTSIDLEPKKDVTSVAQQTARRKPIAVDAPIRNEKVKSDFNLAPIISPIFGSNEMEEKNSTELKVPATGGMKQKKIIDIISPMYGISKAEDSIIKKEKPVNKKRHAVIPETEEQKDEVMQELPDLPLEALIKKEEDIEDDSMQISLFGEDAPIHEDAPSDYKIEE